jgi:hypothetical protein
VRVPEKDAERTPPAAEELPSPKAAVLEGQFFGSGRR